MKTIKSKSKNQDELKAELETLSLNNPDKYYTFSAIFGSVKITEHDRKPSTAYGTSCYETFGGFFRAGKIVSPGSSWMKQYNYIPVQD